MSHKTTQSNDFFLQMLYFTSEREINCTKLVFEDLAVLAHAKKISDIGFFFTQLSQPQITTKLNGSRQSIKIQKIDLKTKNITLDNESNYVPN